MFTLHSLRLLPARWRRTLASHSTSRSRPGRSRVRLSLERLEDRLTPSTLTVTSAADDGSAGTLRTLLATANTDATNGISDTINFDPSLAGATIVLKQGQLELSGTSTTAKITIDGRGLSTPITINGNNANQVFVLNSGVQAEVDGLTITGSPNQGITAAGGPFFGGSLIVNDCTLYGNSGDAISYGGTLNVSQSTLSGNSGDGIDDGGGSVTVTNCSVSNNSGWGIDDEGINSGGSLTVTGTTVSSNGGGGIAGGGQLTVNNCTISGNLNVGLDIGGTAFTVSDSTVSGNSANPGHNAIAPAGIIIGAYSTGTVNGCTLSDNSGSGPYADPALGFGGGGFGGGIMNFGTVTLTGCTLTGNSISAYATPNESSSYAPVDAGGDGGGIANLSTLTLSGCTLSGNSASDSGGGIFNNGNNGSNVNNSSNLYGPGTLTIQSAAAEGVYGVSDPDINSAVINNQAPVGADLENLGLLSINNSAVAVLDDQNSGATTHTVATGDTATSLTASTQSGQIVFTVQVVAAQSGAGTPTAGTVTLYDGNNNVLDANEPLDTTGRYTVTDPAICAKILSSQSPIHAVYSGGGGFNASTSPPLIQTVSALTPDNLQTVVNSLAASDSTAVSLQASDETSWEAAMKTINAVTAPKLNGTPVPITIVLNVASGTYKDLTYSNTDSNVSFILNGSTVAGGTVVNGQSPALTVTAGHVTILNVTFTTATDAPTVLVSGGNLTLRNDVVQESTGYNDAAIAVSGGSVDLGTAASPGGNTINLNGTGQVLTNTGLNVITAVGDTFQSSGTVIFPAATTTLTSSANPALPNQPITFTATVAAPQAGSANPTGSVTFVDLTSNSTLATVPLSGSSASLTVSSLPPGSHTIAAVYSGDSNYITSAVTLSENIHYGFSGFLPPLGNNLAIALGRSVPIKFQLTDYNGYVSSLAAIVSLQVLEPGGTNVLTNAGSTTLRYDSTSNQFVADWQTKGLAAGSYEILLTLADGTTYTKTIQLTAGGSSAGLVTGSSGGTATAGALLGGEVDLYVDNSNGDLTSDELARISDAVNAIDATIAPYGVVINEVSDPTLANVTLSMNSTSSLGGMSQGVLGCTTDADQVTMIQGWTWYAGSDATQVGSGEYDFETAVVHELGHVLDLGHSSSSSSVMYASLSTGTANRALTVADLNVPDTEGGSCALLAAPTGSVSATSNVPGLTAPSNGSSSSGVNPLFAELAGLWSNVWNAYQAELSSLWQQADALVLQRLDAFWSMEAGALGVMKDTRMRSS